MRSGAPRREARVVDWELVRRRTLVAAVAAAALVLPASASAATTYSFTEYPVPAGADARGLAVGSDGALWFGQWRRDGKIGRMTTAGQYSELALPAMPDDQSPATNSVALGPDGAIWYTEEAGDAVGRITPEGSATRYNLPGYDSRYGASSGPHAITAGPDGNLWFLESGPARIARITTGGAITEFPLTGAGDAFDLAAGPDGQLWATSFGGGDVYRVATDGSVTATYHLPTGSSGPRGISPGPDGAMYVVEGPRGKLARITTAGEITEIEGGAAEMVDIAAGPDGAMYATGPDGGGVDGINRLSGGTIERAHTPAGTNDIVLGPDHALWMIEHDSDRLLRVVPGQAGSPPPAPRCVVPKVLGLRLAAAESKIKKAGCKVGTIKRTRAARHVRASRLRVRAQSPRAGASRARGTRVSLTLGNARRR